MVSARKSRMIERLVKRGVYDENYADECDPKELLQKDRLWDDESYANNHERIVKEGLRVRLSLRWLEGSNPGVDDLLAFIVTPVDNKQGLHIRRLSEMHISIAFRNELEGYHWSSCSIEKVAKKWDNAVVHLKFVKYMNSTGYLHPKCSLMHDKDLRWLKQCSARYWPQIRGVTDVNERKYILEKRREFHVAF